jgi:hypothetical protein
LDEFLRGPTGSQWDAYAEQLRKQLPEAPEGLLSAYVRFAPWVAMIFGVLGVLLLLVAGVFVSVLTPLMALGGASGLGAGLGALVSIVIGLILAVLEVVGGYQMRQGRLTGWWILGLGLVVNAVLTLVRLQLLGLIITLLIAYVHLLVKPRYSWTKT